MTQEKKTEANRVRWANQTHYHAGTGMTSALILCVLHKDGPIEPTPNRWNKLDAVEFFSTEEPSCKQCREVAESFLSESFQG